jgi:cytochrome P450
LRSYPGPKLWAGFRLPYIYHQLTGTLPIKVKRLHDKYGPVVRVAPNELAYTSALAWKEIYGFMPGQPQNPKDLASLPADPHGQSVGILKASDAVHSRYRRLMSHAFSAKALEGQHSLIIPYVDLLIQKLKENAARPQNIAAWYNWATFDIIGDLSFGESFHGVRDQRCHPWVETILEGVDAGSVITAAERYGLVFVIKLLMPKAMMEKFNDFFMYSREKVESRLQRGSERPDFISYIMRNDKHGQQMSKEEIMANAEILVVAGSETTATLLSGVTYYLCTNPGVLEKVTREVRDSFSIDQDIHPQSVDKLDYVIAVLTEALRLYPPVAGSVPRISVNGGMIDGGKVPPGVSA